MAKPKLQRRYQDVGVASTIGRLLMISVGFMCNKPKGEDTWAAVCRTGEVGFFKAPGSHNDGTTNTRSQAQSHRLSRFSFLWVLVLYDQSFLAIIPCPPFGRETFALCHCIVEVHNMES